MEMSIFFEELLPRLESIELAGKPTRTVTKFRGWTEIRAGQIQYYLNQIANRNFCGGLSIGLISAWTRGPRLVFRAGEMRCYLGSVLTNVSRWFSFRACSRTGSARGKPRRGFSALSSDRSSESNAAKLPARIRREHTDVECRYPTIESTVQSCGR